MPLNGNLLSIGSLLPRSQFSTHVLLITFYCRKKLYLTGCTLSTLYVFVLVSHLAPGEVLFFDQRVTHMDINISKRCPGDGNP